jgi:hypothetical protein
MDFDKINIYAMTYEDILEYSLSAYKREFGERKFQKVLNCLNNSSKVNKLISETQNKLLPVGHKDILHAINEIPFFIFSSGQTQIVGALMILEYWNKNVNILNNLVSGDFLKNVSINIIQSSKPSFI